MESLNPIIESVSKISGAMAKIAEAIKKLWEFTTKFLYVAFPVVFLVTVMILKPWLGTAVMQGIFAIVGVIGVCLYGYSISQNWTAWRDAIESYWNNQVEAHIMDEGFCMSDEEEAAMLAHLNGSTPEQQRSAGKFLRQTVDDLFGTSSDNQLGGDIITITSAIYCMIGVDYTKRGEVVKALKSITGVAGGAEKFIDAVRNFFATIALNTSAWFGLQATFANALSDEYANWLATAEVYMAKEKTMTLQISQTAIEDLRSHIEHGTVLAMSFEKAGQKTVAHLMSQHLKNLELVLVKVQAGMISMPKERVEPTSLFIAGAPGSGKTLFADMLAEALCRYKLKDHPALLHEFEENPRAFIHNRGTDKWFEGFDARTIVMRHDEFPLTKETTPDDSKQVALIDEVNITAKPLPMANADLKGKVFYNHSFTILTSNKKDLKSDMLLEQRALGRRIHVAISIESKGVANSSKGVEIDPDNWDIHLMEDANISGEIQFVNTGLKLSLQRVFNMLIGIEHMRTQLKARNAPIKKQIYSDLIESAECRAYIVAVNTFKMQAGRVPTHEEVITYLSASKAEFERTLKLNLSFLDMKGKQKVTGGSPQPAIERTPEMEYAYSRAVDQVSAPFRNQARCSKSMSDLRSFLLDVRIVKLWL